MKDIEHAYGRTMLVKNKVHNNQSVFVSKTARLAPATACEGTLVPPSNIYNPGPGTYREVEDWTKETEEDKAKKYI